MISKVLKAQSENKTTSKAASKKGAVYDNKGSALRLANYMEHEAKEQGETGQYFNQDRDEISKDEVVEKIDGNVKGLGKNDAKFYSLIISPSQDELAHIGSDAQKLKEYTRQVMENYAAEYKVKSGNKLESKDLVWYAVVHREREYSGTDKEVKEGKAKSGERKHGDQTHIHIIVSRRDGEQKITLSPTGPRARFSIKNWQKNNAEDFQKMFGYSKQTHYSKDTFKESKLKERIEAFSQKHNLKGYLSAEKIALMGKEQDFDCKFYRNLKTLENTLARGIRPADPYSGLDRKDLYKEFKKLREYQIDNKSDRTLHKQVVNIRSQYLKQHGVSLSEMDLPTKAIKKAYEEHEQKWKFYKNLNELKQTLLKEGKIPEDFEKRLSQKATVEEIAQNQKSYRQSRKQNSTAEKSAEKNYFRENNREGKSYNKEYQIESDKATKEVRENNSYSNKVEREPREQSESKGGRLMAGMSALQSMLNAMSDSDYGSEREWDDKKIHRKHKKRQHSKDQGLDM